MPWITSRPRKRLSRLWGRWKRWEYDHTMDLLTARIGLFIVASVLLLVLLLWTIRL